VYTIEEPLSDRDLNRYESILNEMNSVPGMVEEEMYQLKTMCLAKRAVQMPNKDEHGFLLFCGLGARKWKIGMESNSLSFKQSILNIYPRLRSVIGYNLWTLTKDKKTFERISEKVNSPRRIQAYLGSHFTGCLIIVPVSDIVLMEERREHLRQMDIKEIRSSSVITSPQLADRYVRSVCLVCGKMEKTAGTGTFHSITSDLLPEKDASISITRKLSDVLGINLEAQKRRFMTGEEICKKCLRSLVELVHLEEKIKLTKEDIISSFFNTISKFNKGQVHPPEEERVQESESTPFNLGLYNYRPGFLLPGLGDSLLNSRQRNYRPTGEPFNMYPELQDNRTVGSHSGMDTPDDRSPLLLRRDGRDRTSYEPGSPDRRNCTLTAHSTIVSQDGSECAVSPRPMDQCSLASSFSYSGFDTMTRSGSQGDPDEQEEKEKEEGTDLFNPHDKLILKYETTSPITEEIGMRTETPPVLTHSPGTGGEISASPPALNPVEEEDARERRKPMKKRKRAPETDESEY
jgi:hypothetical protein